MRKLISLIILLTLSNVLRAANLCDSTCNLTITFPAGGTLVANKQVTVTFGDNGILNTGATTTAYSNGETLIFAEGDEITFDANGVFDVGDGGNLNYTNFEIYTTGGVTIEAVGGNEVINLSTTVISAATLIINSNVVLDSELTIIGNLIIGGTGTLTSTGTINIDSGTVTLITNADVSSGIITASDGGALTVSNSGALTIEGGEVVVDSTLSTIETNEIAVDPTVLVLTANNQSSGAVNGGLIIVVSVLLIGFRGRRVAVTH